MEAMRNFFDMQFNFITAMTILAAANLQEQTALNAKL